MGDISYEYATVVTGTSVEADLGKVETHVTSASSASGPPPPPTVTLPDEPTYNPPVGVAKTDRPQRSAVPHRAPAVILDGRPQTMPLYASFTGSYVQHNPLSLAGLASAALDVDLGADFRFVVDDTTLVATPIMNSEDTVHWPSVGFYGWRPSQGNDDLTHTGFDIVQVLDVAFGHVVGGEPTVIADYTYYSRMGPVIRPAVDLTDAAIMLKCGSAYAGSNQLMTRGTNEFTIAIVAEHDEPLWGWCDLAATYTNVTNPYDAKSAVLRMEGDRAFVYANGQRCFDELVPVAAPGPRQPLNLEARRPTIFVWAMSCTGTGSLTIVTPKRSHHGEFTFPALPGAFSLVDPKSMPPWSIGAAPGARAQAGGFMIGANNFQIISADTEIFPWGVMATNPELFGANCVWKLFDVALWDTALETGDCIDVATKLDHVYGVHR